MDSETERVDSDNEVVYDKFLSPERKCYSLRNPPNFNYSYKRATRISMGWNNLIVGSNELYSVAEAYANVVNAISYLIKPTPPTNIITKNNILKNTASRRDTRSLARKEWTMKLKEWTQTVKDWKMKYYLLIEKGIS